MQKSNPKSGGSQVIYTKSAKNKADKNTETQKQKQKKPKKSKNEGKPIGENINSNEWRCAVCTFLNPAEIDVCSVCDSEKGEQRPQK